LLNAKSAYVIVVSEWLLLNAKSAYVIVVSEWLLLNAKSAYVIVVSEWLLLNAKSAIFQLHGHHVKNKLDIEEMMKMSALY
jgi:hypothetical protein